MLISRRYSRSSILSTQPFCISPLQRRLVSVTRASDSKKTHNQPSKSHQIQSIASLTLSTIKQPTNIRCSTNQPLSQLHHTSSPSHFPTTGTTTTTTALPPSPQTQPPAHPSTVVPLPDTVSTLPRISDRESSSPSPSPRSSTSTTPQTTTTRTTTLTLPALSFRRPGDGSTTPKRRHTGWIRIVAWN